MSGRVLVTGATGNVGAEVVALLAAWGEPVRAGLRREPEAALPQGADWAEFDFERPETFSAALDGVDRVFLLRPPHMSDAVAFAPFVSAMEEAGVRQVLFVSLMGVDKNPVVPHRGIEKLLRRSRVPWTFLRPGFYMQNLSTTHLADIVERDEVFVPAGNGRTSLIDARDIAEAAARLLTREGTTGRAYTITGTEALTYAECARILSEETGRDIRYANPSGREFSARMAQRGHASDFITVMRGIYMVCRLHMAGRITDELEEIIGRKPRTFRQFVRDHVDVFGGNGERSRAGA